jgi:hypothetical protein
VGWNYYKAYSKEIGLTPKIEAYIQLIIFENIFYDYRRRGQGGQSASIWGNLEK